MPIKRHKSTIALSVYSSVSDTPQSQRYR